jgi:hypothetical protein
VAVDTDDLLYKIFDSVTLAWLAILKQGIELKEKISGGSYLQSRNDF